MKEIKLKHNKISILKLVMFFAIHNECHIKDESTMKTADLMTKYISANAYCVPISEISINMNLESIKTYLNSMS